MQKPLLKHQYGVTLFGLLIILVLLGFIGIMAAKILPTVSEYYSVKKAVKAVAAEATTAAQIRTAFDRQANVGYITAIEGKDLVFTRKNGSDRMVASFAYDKKIVLFDNVSLLIEYAGSSADE